ncbi:MAG: hypothetical protein ABIG96_01460 [Candidatus Micrarchaeota archaeon]
MENDEIANHLLLKLYRLGAWGTRHVSESNLQKGFPPEARGKWLLRIAEDLRKQGLLFKRPSHHEYQWSLVWEMKPEIERRIEMIAGGENLI